VDTVVMNETINQFQNRLDMSLCSM